MIHRDNELPKTAEWRALGPLINPSRKREDPCVPKKPREGSPREGSLMVKHQTTTEMSGGGCNIVGPSYTTKKYLTVPK
jgi:hypothetical protein